MALKQSDPALDEFLHHHRCNYAAIFQQPQPEPDVGEARAPAPLHCSGPTPPPRVRAPAPTQVRRAVDRLPLMTSSRTASRCTSRRRLWCPCILRLPGTSVPTPPSRLAGPERPAPPRRVPHGPRLIVAPSRLHDRVAASYRAPPAVSDCSMRQLPAPRGRRRHPRARFSTSSGSEPCRVPPPPACRSRALWPPRNRPLSRLSPALAPRHPAAPASGLQPNPAAAPAATRHPTSRVAPAEFAPAIQLAGWMLRLHATRGPPAARAGCWLRPASCRPRRLRLRPSRLSSASSTASDPAPPPADALGWLASRRPRQLGRGPPPLRAGLQPRLHPCPVAFPATRSGAGSPLPRIRPTARPA
nr:vegetative cell wall protein gp1-like [Aegilops tauschii subsp. strangulata]